MDINEKMYELGSSMSIIRSIFEQSKARCKEIGEENVLDFSLGNPIIEPPKEVENALQDLLKTQNPLALHGYTSGPGDMEVRSIIANNLNNKFGTELTANNIYMTCGAAASLTISLKALLNDGDECIVFAPFFTEYKVFIQNANGKIVVSTPLENSFQIDVEDFESKVTEHTKAIIINSPNNPSGVVYTEKILEEVCGILMSKSAQFGHPIYLICDEPYRELVYNGVYVPYLMNMYDNTIVCYSFSKALSLPGERIGYIAVNSNMKNSKEVYLSVCGAGRSLGYVCAPSLFQKVVARCVDAKVNIKAYEKNRNLIYNSLTEIGYQCVQPDGAFYLFVKSLEKDAKEFAKKAVKHELFIVPCDDFGVEGYVRISYCVDYDKIQKSIPAFKKLFDEYK